MTAHRIILVPFSLLLLSLLPVSCSKQEKKETELVTFAMRGEVVAIDTAKMRVTIAHEEIPNYMMAMTMPFKVKDPALLRGLGIGDTVTGTLAVSRTESWLETLSVVGKGEVPAVLKAGDIEMRRLFKVGELFPDESLVDQNGKRIRFSDYRGKVLAATFIYTRCPLPDFCIRMSDHFAKVQKLLKADTRLDGQWHLLTISFDPTFDTPKVLKEYGRSYGAEFSHWTFAVDSMSTIWRLADGLGLTLADDEGLIAHNLRTIVIDKAGRLAKVINGNEWTPEELVAEMRKLK